MNTFSIPAAPPAATVSRKTLLVFMAGWFVINGLQAAVLGLDGDEAYYWMLAQQLDWGYFDHPPMVTLLIRMGESLGHGPFFTRLGTVFITTLSIGMIFAALPNRLKNIKWYLWLFSASLLFNVYSFITTPDAPLLFFSALFFYGYKEFLRKDQLSAILLMALGATGMFYSKYHGILPVFFVVLSNLKLLQKKSFWLMVLMVTILYLPHLYWQYSHDWPTVKFHLFERATKKYKIEYTTNYLLGQLLVWGPIISIFFYVHLRKIKSRNPLIRAHLFNFLGILMLFLFSSFRNNVQPHWTLVGGTSFVVLFMFLIQQGTPRFRKTFFTLCYINIGIIIVARILFLLPHSPFEKIKNYRPFFYGKEWANKVYAAANGKPVIFTDTYATPSLYRFYHPDAQTFGYNTRYYRKTQYSINDLDQALDGKNIFWFIDNATPDASRGIIGLESGYRSGVLQPIDSFNAISHLRIEAANLPNTLIAGKTYTVQLWVSNSGTDTIFNRKQALHLEYSFSPLSYTVNPGAGSWPFPLEKMAPATKFQMTVSIVAPTQAGKNRLLFSFKNGILEGNFASPYYSVEIKHP